MSYTPPTAEQIRDASSMVFSEYGYAKVEEADPLDRLITEAVAELKTALLFQAELILDFGRIDPDTETGAVLKTLLDKIVRMWVEWLVVASQPENIDSVGDIDLHSSSGGRNGPSRRELSSHLQMWHVWPQLDRLLRFVVKLWNEEIDLTQLPADIPAVENPGPLPRPGEWFIDGARISGRSPFDLPAQGVARNYFGS